MTRRNCWQQDILTAGDGLCWPPAVRQLAEEGPPLVYSLLLDRLKVAFTRQQGELEYTQEAAHSTRRILFAADATGRAIADGLSAGVRAIPALPLAPPYRRRSDHPAAPFHRSAGYLRAHRPAWAAICSTRTPAKCAKCWRVKPSWRPADWGRCTCIPPIRAVRAATGWRWRIARGAQIINAEYHPVSSHRLFPPRCRPLPDLRIGARRRRVPAQSAGGALHGTLSSAGRPGAARCGGALDLGGDAP